VAASSRPAGAVVGFARRTLTAAPTRWIALLALCGAYLQGGLTKAMDFPGAIAEMTHFGLTPAVPFAVAVIGLELGASAMILLNLHRWLGALGLAGFTLLASLMANRFWEMALPERFGAANSFFEHLGLAGAFLLVAACDLADRT